MARPGTPRKPSWPLTRIGRRLEHLRVEVTSAIRGRWLAGKLTDERADAAVRTLNRLAIRYASWDELAGRVWELRRNVTPYDAAYLALAEARGCRLVTPDGKLRDCPGLHCEVRVVTSAS